MNNNDLKEVLYQFNPWWTKIYELEGLFPREKYLCSIKKFLNIPHIIVLSGSRRAGKTSILKLLIRDLLRLAEKDPFDILYISFDDPLFLPFVSHKNFLALVLEQFEFIRKKPIDKNSFIIIDEIQTMPNWQLWLKKYYDEGLCKFIVSGSSVSLVQDNFTELTGRSINLQIFPFSFKESVEFDLNITIKPFSELNFKNLEILRESVLPHLTQIKICFEEYKERGGFPEVIKQKDEEVWKEILKNYFDQILYRDIVKIYKVKEITVLENLAFYLMQNISQKFSLRNIAKTIDANVEIVRIFLSYLIKSYLFYTVSYYGGSLKTTLKKMKKIYFIDAGLRHSIVGHKGLDNGFIVENIIFNSIKANFEKVYYWYDKNKYEVDFVARQGNNFYAFESKYADYKTDEKLLKGLFSFLTKKDSAFGFVITRDIFKEENINGKKIVFVPAWLFCLFEFDS